MKKRILSLIASIVILLTMTLPFMPVTVAEASTELNLQVNSSSDDARYYKASSVWTFSYGAEPIYAIGRYDANNAAFGSGMVFDGVTIPQGATIDAAYISVLSYGTGAGTAVTGKIYGQDVDNAATFSTETDFKNRWGVNGGTDYRTTAYADWSITSGWSGGTWYNTPSLVSIVQEIVDRGGWSSGNSMAFTINDWAEASANNNYRWIYGYDGGSSYAPKLHVEYTPVSLAVSTEAATNVGVTSATLNGELTGLTEDSADCYFEWDTDTGEPYANDTSATADTLTETGVFSEALSGLDPGDTIYFRAVADDGVTVEYGSELNFTLDNYVVNYFGDSVTVGTGASVDANCWQELVEAELGYDENNDAVGATRLYQIYSQFTQNSYNSDSITMALVAYNDMRYFGTNTAAYTTFGNAIYSALALAALPSTSVYEADNVNITYTGSWGVSTPYTGINTKYSNTAGSTATATLTGSTVYVDIIQYAGSTCGLKVEIDSVNKGTFYNSSATDVSPYLLRFDGLTNEAHEVVCTVVAGTGYTYINWMGASDGSPDGGIVLVGGSLKMQGYNSYPPYNNGSDTAVTAYNYIIETAVDELTEDGLEIYYVPVNDYFNVTTDFLGGDGVHPNDTGHAHIAEAFLDTYEYATTEPEPPYTSPIISTTMVEGVGRDWAILRGYVVNDRGYDITTVGISHGLTTAYGTNTSQSVNINTGDSFVVTLRNLDAGTTYHWRAYGSYEGSDTGYGDDANFSTEGSPSLREYFNTGGDDDSQITHSTNWTAQQFTTDDISHTVTNIRLSLKRVGNPGTITVSLKHANDSNEPTGLDISSGTYDGDTLFTTYSLIDIEVDEASLDGGEKYAIVLKALAGDSSNYVVWEADSGGGIANSVGSHSTNSGITWTSDTPTDYLFEIWGYDVLEVSGGGVFSGYIETGDLLFAVNYLNEYTPYYPTDDSASHFDLQLYAIDGTTLIASTPLVDWGKRAGSIYLSASMATSITIGNAYYLKIVGSDNPEAIIASYQLESEDWYGDDLTYLDRWVIRMAHIMETYYSETFVTQVSGSGEVLNDYGGVLMDAGIQGLSYVRPNIFKTTVNNPVYETPEYTNAFENYTTWQTKVGDGVATTMNTLGGYIGMDGKGVLQIILVGACIIVALWSGSFFYGILLSVPIMLWGVDLRVIPVAALGVLGAIAASIFIKKAWWS